MDISQPPPELPPPQTQFNSPPIGGPPGNFQPHFRPNFGYHRPHFNHHGNRPYYNKFNSFHNRGFHHGHGHGGHGMMAQDDFDGKRLRKSVMRKTVDYSSSAIKAIEVIFKFITYITILL